MATPSDRAPFKRRSLFKAAGLGAAGTAGLPIVAACSDIESGSGSTQTTEGFDFLPTYKEWPLPVEPDLVGEPPNHPSAFTSYPEPVQAITDLPSGSGSYELTVPCWGPAPAKDDPYFAAVYEAWGGTKLELRQGDGMTYGDTAVQWVKADEYGDGIQLFSYMTGSFSNFQETVVNKFYDLTDILRGDIAERWPLLAAIPSAAWGQAVWSVDPEDPDTAGIYAIPMNYSGGQGNGILARVDLMDAAGIAMPTTVEELLDAARAWSDDANGKWAFAQLDWFIGQWFGLGGTDGWNWDPEQQKMVNNIERPEFTEMLTFRRTLWDEQLIHPDVPTGTLDAAALQEAGQVLFTQDNLVRWNDFNLKVKRGEIEGEVAPLPPLAANGRTPTVAMGAGIGGWTFLNKDLSREQVEEILDIANWAAAPYGTTEYQLLQYGVEGEHFEIGADGTPVFTPLGSEIVQGPVHYKALCCQVETFLTGDPDMVAKRFEYDASIQDYAMENPFEGVRIEAPAEAKAAGSTLWDQQQDIAFGRAELSSIPEMVETFMANGGEDARQYYTDAYKAVHGE
ncbi:type 2 periplasmic-binding domain-containing protein [Glycomyces dulcitolivorans]|uniref:extracellular solute-binding protein n=1 Tax=Glycomyces dulcitolivorans TaxID=2200759 RepID=UPI001300A0D2|nr:extracellular solute-binding protein [Glycomyces dulcitolivorans]